MVDKLLIADDDVDFRSEFKSCLEEYEIVEASSGEEVLDILKKPNDINLVILDEKMSGMDSRLKAVEDKKDVTVKGMREEIARCDKLATDLAPFVGVFDHASMDLKELLDSFNAG